MTINLPISFAATNCKKMLTINAGSEQYWSADFRASRGAELIAEFRGILFVEIPGDIAFIAGIEDQDGVDPQISAETAAQQVGFIKFLRSENAREKSSLKFLAGLFSGQEYSTVEKATLAYMNARPLTHAFGVGFTDQDGVYQMLRLEQDRAA